MSDDLGSPWEHLSGASSFQSATASHKSRFAHVPPIPDSPGSSLCSLGLPRLIPIKVTGVWFRSRLATS